MVIENFAALSTKEQHEFADKLLKTLNSEKAFLDTALVVEDVGADELSGDLVIIAGTTEAVEVEREGTWSTGYSSDEEEAYDLTHATPSSRDVDFEDSEEEAVTKTFKVRSVDLEGYTITIEVDNIAESDIESVSEVNEVTEDDAGIGDYEYFGFRGTDSQPYLVVQGTLFCTIYPYLRLTVAPTVTEVEPEVEEA